MPNYYYIREANHERAILKRYLDLGYLGVRSGGSKGAVGKSHPSLVDLVLWNKTEILFICSQSIPWRLDKQEFIWKLLIRPPNSRLLFIGASQGWETTEDGDELAKKYRWKHEM